MRHRKKDVKLGRTTQHRARMLANMVCSLIRHGRVKTTLQKARAACALADRMVTLGKKGTLHHRRQAIACLCQEDAVRKLFSEIAPRSASRNGGYTRVTRLGTRIGDAATMALLEWMDTIVPVESKTETEEKKDKAKTEKADQTVAKLEKPAAKQ